MQGLERPQPKTVRSLKIVKDLSRELGAVQVLRIPHVGENQIVSPDQAPLLSQMKKELSFNFGRSLSWHRDPIPGDKRQDHGYAAPILRVFSMQLDEIPLLELDRQKNVGGRGEGKDQMCHSHERS